MPVTVIPVSLMASDIDTVIHKLQGSQGKGPFWAADIQGAGINVHEIFEPGLHIGIREIENPKRMHIVFAVQITFVDYIAHLLYHSWGFSVRGMIWQITS